MQMALYEPDLGYYVGTNTIFGPGGDFVTAPELGFLFGRCLARQCRDILAVTGGAIIEYGAGSGSLACTLLEALQDDFDRDALTYHIVEPSPRLRARQRELLSEAVPNLLSRISWSAEHPTHELRGVVIANEMFDALPARRYVAAENQVRELGVALDGEQFVWRVLVDTPVPDDIASALRGFDDGYCCESIPRIGEWFERLQRHLVRGAVLICDYGYAAHEYFHPSRSDGTLKCHYQQAVHDDPFVLPGLQDITTSINFSEVADLAHDAGFEVAGYANQASFLIHTGLDRVLSDASQGDVAHDYTLAQQAKRLLLPGEMGETFKVLALTSNYEPALRGFAADQRHRLGGFVAGHSS